MKKNAVTVLLGVLYSVLVQAQNPAITQMSPFSSSLKKYEVLDTCRLKITYQLKIAPDPQKPDYIYKDIRILEIGKNMAKSYSYLLYQKDSLCTELEAKGAESLPALQQTVLPMEVFVSGKDHQTTVIYRAIANAPVYIYTEPTENIRWNIRDERKEILGYNCQKATATFRGRDYEAWFTTEIPSKYGPYKFVGLPGLILSIQDSLKEYCWECIGIKKGNKDMTIKRYKWEYTKITPEKLETIISKMYDNPILFLQSLGTKIHNLSGKPMTILYTPLEKF